MLALAIDNQAEAKLETGPVDHTVLLGVDYQRNRFSDYGAMFDIDPLDLYDPDYGAELSNKQVYEDSKTRQRQIGIYA